LVFFLGDLDEEVLELFVLLEDELDVGVLDRGAGFQVRGGLSLPSESEVRS